MDRLFVVTVYETLVLVGVVGNESPIITIYSQALFNSFALTVYEVAPNKGVDVLAILFNNLISARWLNRENYVLKFNGRGVHYYKPALSDRQNVFVKIVIDLYSFVFHARDYTAMAQIVKKKM